MKNNEKRSILRAIDLVTVYESPLRFTSVGGTMWICITNEYGSFLFDLCGVKRPRMRSYERDDSLVNPMHSTLSDFLDNNPPCNCALLC